MSDLLKSRQVNTNLAVPTEQEIISIRGETVGTTKNFGVITGSPKSGKSRYLAAFIASAISGIDQFGINVSIPADTFIGHFDTEQGEADILRQAALVKTWIGKENLPPYYKLYSFREDMPPTIKDMIESFVEEYPTKLIVLDGILDMVIDYNNVTESRSFMNWIKKLSKAHDLFILAVIHLGKSEANTLGHIGSMCDRYCQSVLESVKEKNGSYTLRPRLLRSAPGFEPVNIAFSPITKTWSEADYTEAKDQERQYTTKPEMLRSSEHAAYLQIIFAGRGELPYKDIIQGLIEVAGASKAWAKACFKFQLSQRYIGRSALNGSYYIL